MRPSVALISLVTLAFITVSACGELGEGMRRMHAPERIEGSLAEMSADSFFQANCAVCHGDRRQGASGPALLPDMLTRNDDFYFDVIANGSPGMAMPAWSALGLTPEDVRTLVAFLRTGP